MIAESLFEADRQLACYRAKPFFLSLIKALSCPLALVPEVIKTPA
jgi:hypothetical protein